MAKPLYVGVILWSIIMGLLVSVYRSDYDCEMNAFHGKKQICVVNVSGPFEPSAEIPAARLERRGNHCVILPDTEVPKTMTPFMFGGTFASSSDSRFSQATGMYAAIPIHDRCETWEQYNLLSR